MNRTVYNHVVARRSLSPAARTTGTANGASVTGLGYRSATLVVNTGTMTDGTVTVTVEDSATGSGSWVDVVSTRIQGSLPVIAASDDDTIYETGIVIDPARPYLRAVLTTATGATGGLSSAVFLLGGGSPFPVTH